MNKIGTMGLLGLASIMTVGGTTALRMPMAEPPRVLSAAPTSLAAPAEPAAPKVAVAMAETRPVTLQPYLDLPDIPGSLEAIRAALALPPWSKTLDPGDTLGSMLKAAGVDSPMKSAITDALASEYDLRKLKPGYELRVLYGSTPVPVSVELAVGEGKTIEVTLGSTVSARIIEPEAAQVARAGAMEVEGSIYASLDRAGVPTGFANDLGRILDGFVDMQRDLQGGERLSILWDETVLPDGTAVGRPTMRYAAVDVEGMLYEVLWPSEDAGSRHSIYRNGALLKDLVPPVENARLSSVFGPRRHPIFGDMRQHTGVDYAAMRGTPVKSTAAGRIAFVGWRGGYGKVVEITHGNDTMTRYAHLDAIRPGLSAGDVVAADDPIGVVGDTGTATGPNLHFEVRIGGRPVDPIAHQGDGFDKRPDVQGAKAALDATRADFAALAEIDA